MNLTPHINSIVKFHAKHQIHDLKSRTYFRIYDFPSLGSLKRMILRGARRLKLDIRRGGFRMRFRVACTTYACHATSLKKRTFGCYWVFVSSLCTEDWSRKEQCLDCQKNHPISPATQRFQTPGLVLATSCRSQVVCMRWTTESDMLFSLQSCSEFKVCEANVEAFVLSFCSLWLFLPSSCFLDFRFKSFLIVDCLLSFALISSRFLLLNTNIFSFHDCCWTALIEIRSGLEKE